MLPLQKVENFSQASKIVGWDGKTINHYPSIEEIEGSIINNDIVNILRWNRYLRSPNNRNEQKIIEKIVEYLRKYK